MNACDFCQKPLTEAEGALCGKCLWWTLEDRRREWDAGARDVGL